MESINEGIIVVLRFGKLSFVITTSNLALVGKEIIRFQRAELMGKNKYKLGNLIGGQEVTKECKHAEGENLFCLMI